jgi:molybdate transport system ATP-binding protein
VFSVRDKGKLPAGQAVNWVIPNDAIVLVDPGELGPGDFRAEVVEARHLGEITLVTLRVHAVPGAHLVLTLAGVQRQALTLGARLCARLDPGRVHVMPLRTRPRATPPAG